MDTLDAAEQKTSVADGAQKPTSSLAMGALSLACVYCKSDHHSITASAAALYIRMNSNISADTNVLPALERVTVLL